MENQVKKIKKTSKKKKVTSMTAKEREQLLIENFVGLQGAMMNLSVKFETLSDNISKLLHIFELSAKDYLQNSGKESDTDLLKKLDNLMEQNKVIARGLVLIEEKVRHREPIFGAQHPQGHPIQPKKSSVPAQPNLASSSQKHKPLPRI